MGNFQSDGKAIFLVLIGSIIALAIIGIVGTSIIGQTEIQTQTNTTVTAPAVNATLDLTGRTLVSQIDVSEASNSSNSSNGIFLQTGTGTNGLRTVQLTVNDTGSVFAGASVNVSYTYEPDGYLSNAGARAIDSLILIFAALAIMVFVLVVFMKEGSLGKLMGRK